MFECGWVASVFLELANAQSLSHQPVKKQRISVVAAKSKL